MVGSTVSILETTATADLPWNRDRSSRLEWIQSRVLPLVEAQEPRHYSGLFRADPFASKEKDTLFFRHVKLIGTKKMGPRTVRPHQNHSGAGSDFPTYSLRLSYIVSREEMNSLNRLRHGLSLKTSQ